jgi:hypothetical protein
MAMRTIYSIDKDSIFSGQSADIGPRGGRPVGWVTAETPPPEGIAQWNGNGWTVLDERPVPDPAVVLAKERDGMSCSKMQGILVLGEAAWGDVLAYRETATWAEQTVIDSAHNWQRTSENIAFFGYLLGYTDVQMDDMFTAAALVQA